MKRNYWKYVTIILGVMCVYNWIIPPTNGYVRIENNSKVPVEDIIILVGKIHFNNEVVGPGREKEFFFHPENDMNIEVVGALKDKPFYCLGGFVIPHFLFGYSSTIISISSDEIISVINKEAMISTQVTACENEIPDGVVEN